MLMSQEIERTVKEAFLNMEQNDLILRYIILRCLRLLYLRTFDVTRHRVSENFNNINRRNINNLIRLFHLFLPGWIRQASATNLSCCLWCSMACVGSLLASLATKNFATFVVQCISVSLQGASLATCAFAAFL